MKSLLYSFLVVFALGADYYQKIPNADNSFNLKDDGTTNITQLQIDCSANSACKAFSSAGQLKSNSTGATWSATHDLYVRFSSAPLPQPNLWPLPQNYTLGTTDVLINSATFSFIAQPSFTDLTNAFAWFKSIIFTHPSSSMFNEKAGATLPSLTVTVANTNVPLQFGVDESYTLAIPADGTGATLKANTFYGALQGLQTFSQLVYYSFDNHGYVIHNASWNISDFPRFSHRGMLLDVARHFHPLQVVYQFIDSITFAKYNVLHLHMTDDSSWPFESTSSPLLWTAAYSVDERYTQADVKNIIEYARQRGVRTIIEIDSPGHASSMCKGYPQICCTPYCGEMNPSTNATFDLFDNLFAELTGRKPGGGLFPDNFLHLGGDEVNLDCYNQDPQVSSWMKANNYTTEDAFFYYINRTENIAIAQGRSPINWEEVYDHFNKSLNKEVILQTWYYWDTAQKAVADGYRVIWSNGWYLGSQGQTWQGFYGINPVGGIDPSNLHLFLGGEACMWGELVDPSSLFNTVWPTAAAMSERLWSAATVNDANSATPRYEWFRCLLLARGINAAPSTNTYYHMPPNGPGSCWYQ